MSPARIRLRVRICLDYTNRSQLIYSSVLVSTCSDANPSPHVPVLRTDSEMVIDANTNEHSADQILTHGGRNDSVTYYLTVEQMRYSEIAQDHNS